MRKNINGFTVVELMVWIVIFTIWILSVFWLINSSINISSKVKEQVITSNIAREQIELIKNIRNTNWIRMQKWDNLKDYLVDNSLTKSISEIMQSRDTESLYFTIENNYHENNSITMKLLDKDFSETKEILAKSDFIWNIYIDEKWRYTHISWTTPTKLKSYIKISKVKSYNDQKKENILVDWAYKIESTVVSFERWYNKYTVSSIITDWKKE